MNLFATAISVSMMAAVTPDEAAQPIRVSRAGGAPSVVGSAEYFTGKVRIDAPFRPTRRHASAAPPSPSSRARAPHGIPIRWARR
ncbi:cupin [Xanthomonas citri pv. mangiferaeindicae]|nr:cupin [Xanthomonas citri pv. mangiferaeindicae]